MFRDRSERSLTTLANTAEQYFYTAAFLPYKALQMTDAVLRTMFRMMISQKRLLQWEAAAATELRHGRNKWILLKHLSICSVVALVAFLLIDKSARIAAIP